jgi:hypothetical protein
MNKLRKIVDTAKTVLVIAHGIPNNSANKTPTSHEDVPPMKDNDGLPKFRPTLRICSAASTSPRVRLIST